MDDDSDADPQMPMTPMDPSLTTNPVPNSRDRDTYSVGPGAAPGAQDGFRSLDQIIGMSGQSWSRNEEMCSIIDYIERYEGIVAVPADPDIDPLSESETQALEARLQDRTWGFCIFVTDYSPASRAALPDVLDKIIQTTRLRAEWFSRQSSPQVVTQEVIARLRLEVIEDEDSLSGASMDRLRAEFLALIRGRRPDFFPGDELPPGGIRTWMFLVLDREAIEKIQSLGLPPEYDPLKPGVHQEVRRQALKIVDATWERNQESDSTYRGWKFVAMTELTEVYHQVNAEGSPSAIEDMWHSDRTYPTSTLVNN